jgi:RNA polymerase sigma factor (sigma-70 family)
MDNHAPPEPHARARLTHDQAQELVLRIVSTQAESLLRTAYRNSLCDDDAHDAYQRSMEIFLRRVRTLDPRSAHKWIHVVVKREAQELRRVRSGSVPYEAIDFDLHVASDVSTPEERALSKDRARRAGEALGRLKPQERRAMGLKAFGHSYEEIAKATGYSGTKVNRCLTEGRKSFLERFEAIELGAECQRWQPVLSAMVSGEATAAQITDARPHLRNCAACKATLRGLQQSHRPLKAVLPVGLVSLGAKLSGLLERLLPGVAGGGDAGAVAAGGVGLFGIGGAKLAGLLAAGAVATAGGGLVVAQEGHDGAGSRTSPARTVRAAPAPGVAAAMSTPRRTSTAPARVEPAKAAPRRGGRAQRAVVPGSAKRRIEFAPRGSDLASNPPARADPKAVRATAPRPVPSRPDSTRGEFAPQP